MNASALLPKAGFTKQLMYSFPKKTFASMKNNVKSWQWRGYSEKSIVAAMCNI